MSDKSTIEWTDATWNPVTGCSKISPGCKNCYAERFAERWRGIAGHPYENGFDLTLRPERLALPGQWKKPRLVFVNSTSDLFHESIPDAYIRRVFDVMAAAGQHTFQILTKRAERLAQLAPRLTWSPNIWQGVSVETSAYIRRIAHLQRVHAAVRFLSVEPLLGPIPRLPLDGIGWVIVGGESGPGARPMEEAWVVDIRDQCRRAEVPFFFKQWGGVFKKETGRRLRGHTYDAMPALSATPAA
jgi:protein gp37